MSFMAALGDVGMNFLKEGGGYLLDKLTSKDTFNNLFDAGVSMFGGS